jgi:putative ABC transport system permease protein
MFSGRFFSLIMIALVIGLPEAIYIFDTWLENFAFRTTAGWELFVVPSFLIFFITLSTISYQTNQAAWANPADSLKYE